MTDNTEKSISKYFTDSKNILDKSIVQSKDESINYEKNVSNYSSDSKENNKKT